MKRETLILIPGFANNALAWKHQIKQMKDLFTIEVFVMNKFSSRQEMVEDLLKKAPEQFILAGHSMGGWIAQAVAAQAPDRVKKLALLNTWATLTPEIVDLMRELCGSLKGGQSKLVMRHFLPRIIHPSRLHNLFLIGTIFTMLLRFSSQTLIDQLEAMLADPSSLPLHPLIRTPTLVVASDHDTLFSDQHALLSSRISHSQSALIKGSGHQSPLEKPDEVSALLLAFAKN